MNSYLFCQRSKVCGPSKVNIFNQLVKRVTCFQLGNVDVFSRGHIVSARYNCNTCFKLLLSLLHLVINKKIHICELIYTIRFLFYE